MNSTLKRIAILTLIAAPVFGQHPRFSAERYKPEMHQDALMCFWSFVDGSAVDKTPHNFPLTENGTPTYSDRGVVLDASGDYLSTDEWGATVGFYTAPYYIYGDAFTVSGFAKPLSHAYSTALFQLWRSGYTDIGLYHWQGQDQWWGDAHPVAQTDSDLTTVVGQLYHLTVTWDGSDLLLYQDGLLVDSTIGSASTPYFLNSAYAATTYLDIGRLHTYSGFITVVGHVKYYSLARTAEQIKREFQEGPPR